MTKNTLILGLSVCVAILLIAVAVLIASTPSNNQSPAVERGAPESTDTSPSQLPSSDSQANSNEIIDSIAPQVLSPKELFDNLSDTVVSIENYNHAGILQSTGTGFYISDVGHVVTNKHVIKGAGKLVVRVDDKQASIVKAISIAEQGIDIAVLLTYGSDLKHLTFASDAPSIGDDVCVIGNPLGLSKSLSTGTVMGVREYPTGYFGSELTTVQISAPISPGSSGSPVLNSSGKVIGIATSYAEEGQNINFAIASQHVMQLLDSEDAFQPIAVFYEDNNTSRNVVENTPPSSTNESNEPKKKLSELMTRDEAISLLDDYRLNDQQKFSIAKEFQIGSEATFTETSNNTESVSIRLISTYSSFRLKKGLKKEPRAGNPFEDGTWTPPEYDPSRHDRNSIMTFFVENRDGRKLEGLIFSYELYNVFGKAAGSGKVVLTKSVQAGSALLVNEDIVSPIYDIIESNNRHSFKMLITIEKAAFGN